MSLVINTARVAADGRWLKPEAVVDAYLRLRGAGREDLLEGYGKTGSVSRARGELMWLLRELTHLSYAAIGKVMGGRDATTVQHAIGVVQARMLDQPDYAAQMKQVEAYVRDYAKEPPPARDDAARVLARRVLLDDQTATSGSASAALAVCMLSVAAVLRSPDLTDAEARIAARTLIENGGMPHGRA